MISYLIGDRILREKPIDYYSEHQKHVSSSKSPETCGEFIQMYNPLDFTPRPIRTKPSETQSKRIDFGF